MKKFDKKILVIDDEEDVRNYLKTALLNYGFTVVTANDGLEGLDMLDKEKPDLISLDLVMPKHSGIKFYMDLQKNKKWSKTPVLIVTGHARDDLGKVDFDTMMMQGSGVYLEKPVKPDKYIEKVCQLLGIELPDELKKSTEDSDEEIRKQLLDTLMNADSEALKKAFNTIVKNKKD